MNMVNPFEYVYEFERQVAAYTGAKYAVATDCCTHALFLSLYYYKQQHNITRVTLPAHTYVSVAMQCKHLGLEIDFVDTEWSGCYNIGNTNVVDAAPRFRRNQYESGTSTCLSFQFKKIVSTIRGGMILTDDLDFYEWAQRATHDGRDMQVPYEQDTITFAGWHYFMTPETAQMGLAKLQLLPDHNDDCAGSYTYPDISYIKDFK
jgi:dTDP-4-amino-4,6-dideoxygalactose transaminase